MSFTRKECEEWGRNPRINPKTGRKINPNAKQGIYKKLVDQCRKFSIRFSEEECEKWKRDPTRNPKTDRKINPNAKTGMYQKLLRQCGLPISSVIETRRENCINDIDPISQDRLDDIPLENIIGIGNDRKHCYDIDTILPFVLDRIQRGQRLIDPLNPSYIITNEELQKIFEIARRRDPNFIEPQRQQYPRDYILEIINDPIFTNFYRIQIRMSSRYNIILLGYVPADIEIEQTGNLNYTSASVIAGINQLWNEGRLLTSVNPIRCCTIPLPRGVNEWNRGDFMNKFRELADAIYREL